LINSSILSLYHSVRCCIKEVKIKILFIGKEEVTSSNLVIGSSENKEIPQELLLVFKFSVAFAKLITNYSTIRGY